jgi:hypothetical protein
MLLQTAGLLLFLQGRLPGDLQCLCLHVWQVQKADGINNYKLAAPSTRFRHIE